MIPRPVRPLDLSSGHFFAFLCLLTAMGPMSVQIFIPAQPLVAAGLNTNDTAAQLTISLPLLMSAISSLFLGQISDVYGRRNMALISLVLFMVGSFLSLIAPSIWVLVPARMIQAGGAVVGMALARAMIRDVYASSDVPKMIALITVFMIAVPLFAMIAGGMLTDAFGWRAVFIFTLIVATLALITAAMFLQETLPSQDGKPRPDLTALFAQFFHAVGVLNRIPLFWFLTLASACGISIFYAFISNFNTLVVEAHSAIIFGSMIAPLAISYSIGNFLVSRYATPHLMLPMIWMGSIVIAAMTIISGLLVFFTNPSFSLLFALMAIGGFSQGFIMPNVQAAIVLLRDAHAGAASGYAAAIQLVAAALFTQVPSLLSLDLINSVSMVLIFLGLAGLIFAWLIARSAEFQRLTQSMEA